MFTTGSKTLIGATVLAAVAVGAMASNSAALSAHCAAGASKRNCRALTPPGLTVPLSPDHKWRWFRRV